MLVDSPQKRLSSPKRRKITDVQHRYSDSQKMEALKLYLITGNLAIVSAELNIGYKTLQYWKYSQWWEELTKQIKTEGKIQLSNRLRSIAEIAMDAVKDRLQNGEWVMSPTGELTRKQVSLRDAQRVVVDNIHTAVEIESEQDQGQTNERIADRLASLADAFATFARKTTKVEVVDVESKDLNALPDERETGLQEGSQMGEDHSSSQSEAEGGEDGSQEGDAEGRESVPERQLNGGPQERTHPGRVELKGEPPGRVRPYQST